MTCFQSLVGSNLHGSGMYNIVGHRVKKRNSVWTNAAISGFNSSSSTTGPNDCGRHQKNVTVESIVLDGSCRE